VRQTFVWFLKLTYIRKKPASLPVFSEGAGSLMSDPVLLYVLFYNQEGVSKITSFDGYMLSELP
jgi:hypothetical protein